MRLPFPFSRPFAAKLTLAATVMLFTLPNTAQAQFCSADDLFFNEASYDVGDSPRSLVSADFDDDFVLDLIVVNSDSTDISFLSGEADGTFAAETRFSDQVVGISTATADLNEDGIRDFITSDPQSGNVSIYLGRADGTFDPRSVFNSLVSTYIVVADFNGDGSFDIATTGGEEVPERRVTIALGNGDGTFDPSVLRFDSGAAIPGAIVVADFNGDEVLDLATADPVNPRVGVLLGVGDGTFTTRSFGTSFAATDIVAADFNEDGIPDLATVADDQVFVNRGLGDGRFNPALIYAAGDAPFSIEATDINGDNNLDILVTSSENGNITVLPGRGSVTFDPAVTYGDFTGSSLDLIVSDFNQDGRTDIAAVNDGNNNVSVFLSRCGDNPCVADFDGDGELTIFDFLEFQNDFDAGDARADLDGDGELTLFDFLEFQNLFAAGCDG